MNSYRNLKIANKLIIGFIIIAFISLVIGIISIININKIVSNGKELYTENMLPLKPLSVMETDFLKIRTSLRDMIITKNDSDRAKFSSNIDSLFNEMDNLHKEYKNHISSTEEASNEAKMDGLISQYSTLVAQAKNLISSNKNDEAYALMNGQGGTIAQELDKCITTSFDLNDSQGGERQKANESKGTTTLVIIIVVALAGMGLAVFLGIIISKIISRPINKLVEAANKMSEGNLDFELTIDTKDEVGTLAKSFEKIVDSLKDLIKDSNMLAQAAVEGKLATRADASKHNGDYRKIVEGVNSTLDSVIGPLNVAADYVDKISKGNIPSKIIDTYNGDFNIIKNNLNNCIDNINALVTDANMLAQAAVEGKLATRADASKHDGDYKKIVEGVNSTLDSVIGPLNVAADYVDKISKGNIPSKITDTYNGDFNVIKNNLNECIDNINALVNDANMLVQAAVEGRLSTRADASKHSGDYRKIVEGVNRTLDAVIEPVNEAAEVLKQMSNGNLNVKVEGNYKGDHAEIKNALNGTIDAVSSYIKEISEVLGEISNSNLNVSINNQYKGDFSEIKDALNNIVETFNDVFREINNAADQVDAGSNQVSDGSQALSQGTTEQAASIEELTSSISEIAQQTKQNAVNASQANELSVNAKDGAAEGNVHMQEMLQAMEEINESSSSISKIIKVIDDIAFQTNILALNAAVEAARAGQHGKGFAVVAEEVRNLAARSANAAKETTDLIEGSIKKVELGTKIANSTAESLEQIVNEVTKAAVLVGEIATASNEQATAIAQINKGIEQVSEVVQTNSATAEESAAACEELSSQAALLKNMVEKFKLKKSAFKYSNESKLSYDDNNKKSSYSEAAATKAKPKIFLGDNDFGKY